MRGNGEAVVTARIDLTNSGDQPEKSFAFEIPQLSVSSLDGYQQQFTSPVCTGIYSTPNSTPGATGGSSAILPRPCPLAQQPDIATVGSYSKLTFVNEGNGKYHTELPTAIQPQGTATLLIGYAGTGYATEHLGAWTINFQTLKVNERVKTASVGLDVDTDMYLLDAKSKVNYQRGSGAAVSLPAISNGAAASKALDDVASSIGGGAISKEADNLAAGENLTVHGTYADAAWKLYPGRVAALALGGLAVLVFVAWLVRRMNRRVHPVVPAAEPVKSVTRPGAKQLEGQHLPSSLADPQIILAALGSAVATGLITWALMYVGNQDSVSVDTFTEVIMAIVGILAYVLVVVGPVVWLAMKRRDWRVAVYMFVWQVAWLLVILLVYVFGLRALLSQPSSDPGIIQPMGGGTISN
jgi:hypothetical protein